MTTDIEIRDLPAQRLLVKKTSCGHREIGLAFGKAIQNVGECLRAGESTMASAPMAVYLSWRAADCDLAAGCQVTDDLRLSHGCEWLHLPGGAHASATHFGPYDTLQETHQAILQWCEANGRKIAGPCFESYSNDPGNEPDSGKWQTDVFYPVA